MAFVGEHAVPCPPCLPGIAYHPPAGDPIGLTARRTLCIAASTRGRISPKGVARRYLLHYEYELGIQLVHDRHGDRHA